MKRLMLMILGITFLIACESNTHKESDINLNDGAKWEVNSEMKPHIDKANAILHNYVSDGDDDYNGLAEALKNQNNSLIENCTMQGKSHDELHKWLHPHIELVEDLSNAKDKGEAERIVSKLEESFETFYDHFH